MWVINIKSFALVSCLASLVLAASAAQSYWAAVETTAYDGDQSNGANVANYAMYYCTVEAAEKLFGGASVDAIEGYVSKNFASAKGLATTFDSVAYTDGEYQILDYVSAAFGTSAFVALAFYGNDAYRVYGQGSAALTPYGQLAFNEAYAAAGTVGDWQQNVPEPTSGLLVLVGLAGLALKRKWVRA